MKASKVFASALLACLLAVNTPTTADAQGLHADLVITNANVRTMDKQRPRAEAVAVLGNRIVAVNSTTALFFEPYRDAPETSGLPGDEMFPEGAMLKRIEGADKAGLQVMIHAIGDKANDIILALYDEASKTNGERERRFRVEHAQHLHAEEIREFARLKVVASMQPFHLIDDGRWAEKRIGPERLKGTYAFRALLDAGVVLAFGSDWTVAPLDPLLGIYAAVTRRTLDGKNPSGWVPEQKISVEEAVRAYTFGSAYAEFADGVKGTIAPGKLADIVILSDDIFRIDPTEIEKARVRLTIMDGRVIYEAGVADKR